MASTTMSSSNSNAVKLYEKKVWVQAMQQAVLGHAFNRGSVYFPEKFAKLSDESKGDQVTFPYVGKLTGVPIGEGGTADGNEEALDIQSHSMIFNESRIPVLNPNGHTIEQQRTHIEFAKVTQELLTRRAVELMDSSFFQQLAGVNPTSMTLNGTTYSTTAAKLHVQGHNTPVAPTTNRITRAAAAATDQALTSSDTMTLDLIDDVLQANMLSDQPIEPCADGTYDLYISPEQYKALKRDTTSAIQWYNIELAKIQGSSDNTLENNYKNKMVCAGRYSNVNIYVAPRVAYGANSSTSAVITTVRRAVLVGLNAVSFGSPFGGQVTDSNVPSKLFYQMKDYDHYKGVSCDLLYGLKKMSPSNKEDIGVHVISTYAA